MVNRLLKRLDDIGQSLERTPNALALLGLGSVGLSRNRLDEYSDLDFFVICENGYKESYRKDLSWLDSISPLVYAFQNTKDGYKALYGDNIFCEFAIFEKDEMATIPFSKGKIIWKREDFDEAICEPKLMATKSKREVEYLLGEALTNIYVGLGRYYRGEKLSGYKFIQEYAFSRVIELISMIDTALDVEEDQYAISRRFEFRYPKYNTILSNMLLGYDHTIEAASNILTFLENNFKINPSMSQFLHEMLNHKESI